MSEPTILDDIVTQTPEDKPTEPSNYIDELVGEGKKYSSPEELAKAYVHAETHINTVIGEKRDLESKYSTMVENQKTLEDVINAIETPASPAPVTPEPTGENPQSYSADDIDQLVTQKFNEREQAREAKARKEQIQTKLGETFGSLEEAAKAIQKYTGGDKDKLAMMDKLVLVDFDAAVKLLSGGEVKPVNFSDGAEEAKVTMPTDISGDITWSQVQKIRKENPKLFWSTEFQLKLHDAQNKNPKFLET